MSREVLKMALMAIEELRYSSSTFKSDKLSAEAIPAIKEALAQPEFLSTNEADIAQLIEERDVREDILDKVLDMVLGIDRPEWSSSYQYIDAVEDVREALAQPDNTAKLYEELRVLIDGGSESFTHEDAVQYLKDNLAPLKWTPEEDTAYRPGGLAQPELSDYQCCDCKTRLFCGADCHVCGSFSAEDIPQEHPEQMARLGWQYVECPACGSEGARAFPKPEQEPVAVTGGGKTYQDLEFLPNAPQLENGTLLYTSPPQRQPLTDKEIEAVYEDASGQSLRPQDYRIVLQFARAIEAAHNIGGATP